MQTDGQICTVIGQGSSPVGAAYSSIWLAKENFKVICVLWPWGEAPFRAESKEEKGRGGREDAVYRVYRVTPQGHITALIQFHVNLRVNATLIRWRVVAAVVVDAAAAKATPDPGLTCGTARFKCVRGTGKVRCAGAFKIIYNICENMFAKCQTTLSSAALCNFFLARPEKVCYSFFAFFPSPSLGVPFFLQ